MKLKFDVTAQEYTIIQTLLNKHLNSVCKVWVFGSRAKNTSRFNSDLDLALDCGSRLPTKTIAILKDAFNEAKLAFSIDLVDMHRVEDYFKQIIDEQKVTFPMKWNVPELRFSEFNENYIKHLFENIFLFSTGKNIKQNEASPEYKTPCVRYGELYHLYDEVITQVVNKTNLNESELTFSEGNEILLPSAGEDPLDIGSASALTLKNIAIGRTINILRPKEKNAYSQIYVSYYINQKLRKKISTLARGVSISNVYNSDLKTLTINLPTLPEQQKIATFLSTIDKKLGYLRRKYELLESYKWGVMQKIFSQEFRFKQDDASAELSRSSADFPDWEEKRLGDVTTFKRGKGISKSDINENGATPCIRYGELYTKYSEKITSVISKTNICEKDLILSNGNEVLIPSSGESAIDIATASCVLQKDVALGGDINILSTKEDGVFLAYYLKNHYKISIAKLGQGNSVVHLYAKDLSLLKMNIPSLEEQQKIANFLSILDKKLEAIKRQIDQIKTFKKGLLQKMFV